MLPKKETTYWRGWWPGCDAINAILPNRLQLPAIAVSQRQPRPWPMATSILQTYDIQDFQTASLKKDALSAVNYYHKWLTDLRFYVPSHFGHVPKPISRFGMERQNLTQQSTHLPIKRNILQHKINIKNLRPGLVASYDIRPGNGEGLFWFRRFINLSLTQTLTHLLTALDPHGAWPQITEYKNTPRAYWSDPSVKCNLFSERAASFSRCTWISCSNTPKQHSLR